MTATEGEVMKWIPVWLEIGKQNPWIRRAADPEFTEKGFVECGSYEEMYEKAALGNWCTGTAFYHKDICLIQQVNGGDEWLVIKQDVAFESFSLRLMGREEFLKAMKAIERAPLEDCKRLDYMKWGEVA